MPKTTKEVVEQEITETKIMVKTIMVGYERKINPANYDPRLPYESVGEPITVWADLVDPVNIEDIDPIFERMEIKVKGKVNETASDIIRKLTEKGRTPKLEMNAVYGAFTDLVMQSGMTKEDAANQWQEFIKSVAAYSKENFT